MQTEDLQFMERAAALAEKGKGKVNPNPLVGAVIVRHGAVIGEGWHEYYGGLHAERNAFACCSASAQGATLYVTLEPCCHYGKTPPCTEAIITNGISRVVVGLPDPNPLVAGKGIQQLQAAGIEVVRCPEMEEKLREQNRVFLKYIATGKPWVTLKTAMTLDGKIATYTGDSRWVTGEESRRRVQEMRREYMGIMVGIGTVLADDPLLNCRLEGEGRQPIRIVVDSHGRIPLESRLVKTARQYRTIVAHTAAVDAEQIKALQEAGIETLCCKSEEGKVEVTDLLSRLGAMKIDGILLEGGGTLDEAFLRKHQVDEVFAFIAPKIIGGREAKTPVEGTGIERMQDAVLLSDLQVEKVGRDILVQGKILKV